MIDLFMMIPNDGFIYMTSNGSLFMMTSNDRCIHDDI